MYTYIIVCIFESLFVTHCRRDGIRVGLRGPSWATGPEPVYTTYTYISLSLSLYIYIYIYVYIPYICLYN